MTDQPNIIVVGASARAAAFSALRAGLRPYAIDLFADSDLVDACPAVKIKQYPQDFEQAMGESPQAGWIYTGGLENCPQLIDRMAALRPLYGNGAGVLRRIRDPELLATRLAAAGFEMPEIRNSPPELSSERQWLLKPRRSSAGLGIRRLDAAASRRNDEEHYYQQYIPGSSRSAVYLARRVECQLLGVTDQQSGVPELPDEPFLYSGSAVVHPTPDEIHRLQALGRVLAQEFGLCGLFNVDYVDDGRKIWPLEVNPRYSASLEVLEYSHGKNFLPMHIAQFNPSVECRYDRSVSHSLRHVAKRIVYATSGCVVTSGLDDLRKAWNLNPFLPYLADIPRTCDRILRGQPVATVIAEGESDEGMRRVLDERVRAVSHALSPA